MLFFSKALSTLRTVWLLEVVVVFVFWLLLSGVLRLDAMVLLILLSWCKFRFVRGKRWGKACENSKVGGLSGIRISQGGSVLKEVDGFEEPECWISVFRSTVGVLVG